MNICVYREPFFHLVFKDFFTKSANKAILKEVVKNQRRFTEAGVGSQTKIRYNIRSNMVCYYDQTYRPKATNCTPEQVSRARQKSTLLREIDKKFKNEEFREVLASSAYPICDFGMTSTHETQVSRYGHNQKYGWHIDRLDNMSRVLTLIYYFFQEPSKWKGGELGLTDSPIYEGTTIEASRETKINPQNNMAVVFGGHMAHCVFPTIEPKSLRFDEGRFSANMWIGFK